MISSTFYTILEIYSAGQQIKCLLLFNKWPSTKIVKYFFMKCPKWSNKNNRGVFCGQAQMISYVWSKFAKSNCTNKSIIKCDQIKALGVRLFHQS